jgi:hypothetical protein
MTILAHQRRHAMNRNMRLALQASGRTMIFGQLMIWIMMQQ